MVQQQQTAIPADSTEEIIARQIEAIKKMIRVHGSAAEEEEEEEAAIQINPATKSHFELEIKTLQDAPRKPDKLRKVLKARQREYD